MEKRNACFYIKRFFVDYHSLFTNKGLNCKLNSQWQPKTAASHVLSAIKPMSFKEKVESNLLFSHHDLRKNFLMFLTHAVRILKALQLLEAGPRKRKQEKLRERRLWNIKVSRSMTQDRTSGENKTIKKRKLICIFEPRRKRGLKHHFRD